MAEFEVANLITVLGARFDPIGFEKFDKAMGVAETTVKQLRSELAQGFVVTGDTTQIESRIKQLGVAVVQTQRAMAGASEEAQAVLQQQIDTLMLEGVELTKLLDKRRAGRRSLEQMRTAYLETAKAAAAMSKEMASSGKGLVETQGQIDAVKTSMAGLTKELGAISKQMALGRTRVKAMGGDYDVLVGRAAALRTEIAQLAESESQAVIAGRKLADETRALKREMGASKAVPLLGYAPTRGTSELPTIESLTEAKAIADPLKIELADLKALAKGLEGQLVGGDWFVGGIENAVKLRTELAAVKLGIGQVEAELTSANRAIARAQAGGLQMPGGLRPKERVQPLEPAGSDVTVRPSRSILASAKSALAPLHAELATLDLDAKKLDRDMNLTGAVGGDTKALELMRLELAKIQARQAQIKDQSLGSEKVLAAENAYKRLNGTVRETLSLQEAINRSRVTGDRAILRQTLQARRENAERSRVLEGFKGIVKFAALTLGVTELFGQIKKTLDAANEFQVAQARLQNAVHNSGLSFQRYDKDIEATTHRLRELSGFTDYEIQDSLSNAIRTVGKAGTAAQRYAKSWQIVQVALDIARTKHIGLAAATSIVARAQGGYYLGLTRLGIQVVKVTSHVDALRKKLAEHTSGFTTWATGFRRWEADQISYMHSIHADSQAIQRFKDASESLYLSHKRVADAQSGVTHAQLAAAKAADKASTAHLAFLQLQVKFHGQAAAYAKTFEGSMDRLRAHIDATRESMSRELLPALTQFVNYLSKNLIGGISRMTTELDGDFRKIGKSIEDVALNSQSFFDGLAGAGVAAVGILTQGVVLLTGAFSALSNIFGANNIAFFIAAVYGATKALEAMRIVLQLTYVDLVRMSFADAFTAFSDSIRAGEGSLAAFSSGFKALTGSLSAAVGLIGPEGAILVGVGLLATAIYYLSTQQSAADAETQKLTSSVEGLGNAYQSQLNAVLALKNAQLALKGQQMQLREENKKLRQDNRDLAVAEWELHTARLAGASKETIYKAQQRVNDLKSQRDHDKLSRDQTKVYVAQDVAAVRSGYGERAKARKAESDQRKLVVSGLVAFYQQMADNQKRFETQIDTHGHHLISLAQLKQLQAGPSQGILKFLSQAVGGHLKDQEGNAIHFGKVYETALRSVLVVAKQVGAIPPQKLVTLVLQHPRLAPQLEAIQTQIGRFLKPRELQFFVSHPKLRGLLDQITQLTGRFPTQVNLDAKDAPKKLRELLRKAQLTVPANIDHRQITTDAKAVREQFHQVLKDPFSVRLKPDSDAQKLLNGIQALQTSGIQIPISLQPPSQTPSQGGTSGGSLFPSFPGVAANAGGGRITRPTLTMIGEEAPRYPEYVFSTNPRDLHANAGAFHELASAYGLRVESRAHGTQAKVKLPKPPPWMTIEQVSQWLAALGGVNEQIALSGLSPSERAQILAYRSKAIATGAKQKKKPTTGAAPKTPLDIFTADLQASSDAYTVAYDQLDLRLARAESTTSTVDDDAANRALILLERGRIGTVRKELSDPRFRTIKGTDQLKAGLLSEQAGLIRSIYSQQQTITQARDAKLQALLSPHDQYLLDRAIARNDVSTQAMYYRRELVELEKLRKGAVAKGQWSYADQIEQQIASVQSSLQGLSGTQPSSQVISDLQAQAEALLGPGEAFTREAASGAFGKGAVKAGRRAAASFGGEGLAAVAEGAITINVNTLGVNDPRTKLAIGRSITASVQQAHRRRQPNRRTRL